MLLQQAGEYSALAAARALSLEAAARLVRIRGRAMQQAVPVGTGAMAALLGLDFGLAELSASYYKRQSDHRLLYVGLSGTFGNNLDLDETLVLGGDTGLRGYPLRFQSGESRAVFTIEQRYFTDWYPFRLFHVGGAVFFDAGRTWGENLAGAPGEQLLRDVGAGLRIASSRSGLGRMIHVDVAMPLDDTDGIDGLQFLISTRKSF